MIKLDLGCGRNKHDGCIGIDWSPENSDADIIADLNQGIPLVDDSVVEVLAIHFLEHVADLTFMLKEIHRVCKPGARIHVEVPHFWHSSSVENPEHKQRFTFHTFKYYDGNGHEREGNFPKLFRVIRRKWICDSPKFVNLLPTVIALNVSPFRELVGRLQFELEVVK